MKLKFRIIFSLGLILLTLMNYRIAYADSISLICIRENGTHSFPVEFSEIKKTVRTNFGESPAEIDKEKIVFTASTKENVLYLFIIYRATGRMELWNENTKKQLTPYVCNISKPKF